MDGYIKYKTVSPECVSITLAKGGSLATASASNTPVEYLTHGTVVEVWYVNRVWVHGDHRRQGIGSAVLQELKDAIEEQCRKSSASPRKMLVTPGGYGSDPKDLHHFYVKNGFTQVFEGVYTYDITLEEEPRDESTTGKTQES